MARRKSDSPQKAALREMMSNYLKENQIDPDDVVYIGNDINDLPCFPLVDCAVTPADANPQVKNEADIILSHNGGEGAVRELCEMIMNQE